MITSVAKAKATVTNSFLLAGTTEEDKRFEQETIDVQDRVQNAPEEMDEQGLQEITSTKDQR